MSTKNLHVIIIPVLIALFAVSYVSFSQYRPKVLRQLAEVKGLATEDADIKVIPTPTGSEQMGSSNSVDSEIITFKTKKTKQQVQDFYRNVFSGKTWKIESKASYNDFITIKYRNGNHVVTVNTYNTETPYNAFASIESVGQNN